MSKKVLTILFFVFWALAGSQILSEVSVTDRSAYGGEVFAQVDTSWVRRYSGPGYYGSDDARAITVDGSNNVYVTGWSVGSGTYEDYATIKYEPDGDTAWVRRYNGPGNSYDYARAISLDNSGNVYVTGRSEGSGTSYDYATIKYEPDGDTAWVRRYNGPGNSGDEARAITVDSFGNVYVTGWSFSGIYGDYATIKYDPNGNQLWVRIYNGPVSHGDYAFAIALDHFGNVYVTGSSWGGDEPFYDDYATIKYEPDGDTAWVRRYNGANSTDCARAIAIDDSNNVYVTGYSVGSGSYEDYATIKYEPNGDTAWVRRYNGPGNSYDYARAIALDDSGNVYVTGHSGRWSGTYEDYATIKYDSSGNELWVRRYDGPGSSSDTANAIAVDGSGNVYVTGWSYANATSYDYATIKYYTDGDTAWVRRYNGPLGNGWDAARAIALDGSGNVYVTGVSPGIGTGKDYATIKYCQSYPPTVTAPDSSKFFCEPDTISFTVTATDPDAGDILILSGPGISTPIEGLSPLSANIKIYTSSTGIYAYVYQVVSCCGVDYDTATWVVTIDSPPNSLSLLSPPDGDSIPYVVSFDWEDATDPDSGDIVRYDLYVSTSSVFHPDSTVIYESLLASQYTDTLEIGKYYWKVRAYDSCVETWSTQTWIFYVFLRGDANGDGVINSVDVVYLVNYLYIHGPAPIPLEAGNINSDGVIDATDVVYLINYLFIGGPPPGRK